MDLTKPEYGDGQIAQVIGQSGGTTWTRIMFERQVLGEDYWAKQAATKPKLYPSGAPCSDALVRGEFSIAPLVYNIVYPKQRDGAPIKTFFPPEGVPIVPYGSGIPKTAQNPNAARLYMDWLLSEEGQTFQIKQHGNLTSLKVPPLLPEGFAKDTKVWVPKFAEFEGALRQVDRGMEQGLRVSAMKHSHDSLLFVAGPRSRSGSSRLRCFRADRTGAVRTARADRSRQEGRQARLLFGQRRRERAAGHRCLQQALSVHQGRVPARAGQSADPAREDRSRGRQAARRRDRSFRSLADARDRESVPGLRAAECRRLHSGDARVSPKLWPRSTVVWSIAYNSEIVKNPPKTWADLTKPEYNGKQIGQVIAPSGGTTWTRAMFERQVLGEDYWKKQAATQPLLFPSNAPTSDALVRGEISIAPLLYNAIFPKLRDGAPVKVVLRARRRADHAVRGRYHRRPPRNPNAAKLFMNWCLSEEGQATMIKEIGNLTSLKKAPLYPEGFDPKVVKVWVPNYEQFVKLQKDWLEEWNKTVLVYRQ